MVIVLYCIDVIAGYLSCIDRNATEGLVPPFDCLRQSLVQSMELPDLLVRIGGAFYQERGAFIPLPY